MQIESFLLGLSNGGSCLAYCAPAVVPYLLGEGRGVLPNFGVTFQFLAGRFSAYLLFAVAAWWVNRSLPLFAGGSHFLIGPAYLVFSGLLIFYGFFAKRSACPGSRWRRLFDSGGTKLAAVLPLVAGFATGLSFCPPLLVAFAGAAQKPNLPECLFFFFSFFLGTSIFILPLPFLGFLRGFSAPRVVGKMAAGLVGVYYFYTGILLSIGGS